MTNVQDWIRKVTADHRVQAVPVMTHPGIELTGHTVREAVTDGEVHFAAVRAVAERYPTAAATAIMDLTVEAEAFGAPIAFGEHSVPAVAGRLLTDAEAIRRIAVPPLRSGRVPQYLKANLLAAGEITDRPVFGGCIGPFSLAGRLYGMSEIMVLLCEEPEIAELLLVKCTRFLLKYCAAIKATGTAGVLMAEPAAGLLSEEQSRRFSSAYVRRIVEAVQDDTFAVVLHNCGDTGHGVRAMVATGAAAYHFGNKVRLAQIMHEVPPTALVMGNLDPVSLFLEGSPEQMREAAARLLEEMAPYPNFVLSSGCDTPPATPEANIEAFFAALADYNSRHAAAR